MFPLKRLYFPATVDERSQVSSVDACSCFFVDSSSSFVLFVSRRFMMAQKGLT